VVGASLGLSLLVRVLTPALGLWSLVVAFNLVGLDPGAAISAICGTENKRSFLIAAVYLVVDLLITFGFYLIFR
jgi:hypothetical protein